MVLFFKWYVLLKLKVIAVFAIEIDHFKNRDVLYSSFIFRLTYYKTVGNTSVLGVAGSVDSMCGDTLKLLFKYRGKVYVKLSPGKSVFSRTLHSATIRQFKGRRSRIVRGCTRRLVWYCKSL